MGTWGPGIYDNDSTMDYVKGIINYHVNIIRDLIRWDFTLLHPGMTQSNLFMCHIDILNAICSREDLNYLLPPTTEIKKWKAKYMEVWNFCVDETKPEDNYKTERSEVLNTSLDNLISLAKLRDKRKAELVKARLVRQ